MERERCCICDEYTGRAGKADDSIYIIIIAQLMSYVDGDEVGPLCNDCRDSLEQLGMVCNAYN